MELTTDWSEDVYLENFEDLSPPEFTGDLVDVFSLSKADFGKVDNQISEPSNTVVLNTHYNANNQIAESEPPSIIVLDIYHYMHFSKYFDESDFWITMPDTSSVPVGFLISETNLQSKVRNKMMLSLFRIGDKYTEHLRGSHQLFKTVLIVTSIIFRLNAESSHIS